jgi:hypothetical protein
VPLESLWKRYRLWDLIRKEPAPKRFRKRWLALYARGSQGSGCANCSRVRKRLEQLLDSEEVVPMSVSDVDERQVALE